MIGKMFVAVNDGDLGKTIETMGQEASDWTARAARGECAWVCADCGYSFPNGMPDECAHGDHRCTDIIKRDKEAAAK